MPNDPAAPRWGEPEDPKLISERVVASTGEPFSLRDAGLLESVWGRPIKLGLTSAVRTC